MKKRSYERSDQWPLEGGGRRYVNRQYTGAKKHLKGRDAIIIASTRPGYVLAQFGCLWDKKTDSAVFDQLCFGWHMFSQLSFRSRKVRNDYARR